MHNSNQQNGFSKLYEKNMLSPNHIDIDENSIEHPFAFIEIYLEKDKSNYDLQLFEHWAFFLKQLKEEQNYSYYCFELELNLLYTNKNNYLNEMVLILINIKQTIKLKSIKNVYLRLLNVIVNDILKNIFISYHLDLNSKNRIKLTPWFHLKEPILSFRLIKYPEDKRLKRLMMRYLSLIFISKDTKFSTFKALFEGRYLENKINWMGNKSSLYYFIKLLISNKVIRNPKNKHWKIASEFFLLKGETLTPNDFLNQKETKHKRKRKELELFVKALKG